MVLVVLVFLGMVLPGGPGDSPGTASGGPGKLNTRTQRGRVTGDQGVVLLVVLVVLVFLGNGPGGPGDCPGRGSGGPGKVNLVVLGGLTHAEGTRWQVTRGWSWWFLVFLGMVLVVLGMALEVVLVVLEGLPHARIGGIIKLYMVI